MYSNKRRCHIHYIHQYEGATKKYTGSRVVIFWKKECNKEIFDIGDFKIHEYKNSKLKKHSISKWTVRECGLKDVIKKEMFNKSVDEKYEMHHILYESTNRELEEYLDEVMKIELARLKDFK